MLILDLRQAVRSLRRWPTLSLLVVLTLGGGIGASSAMFALVNATLLAPLPFPAPERLVFVYGSFAQSDSAWISPPDFVDYRSRQKALVSFAGIQPYRSAALLSPSGEPERVPSANVTAGFFEALGTSPIVGRTFGRADEMDALGKPVLLGEAVWRRAFAADPRVVGRGVVVDGQARTVVGVVPDRLGTVSEAEVFLPVELASEESAIRRFHSLLGIGRLAPGASIAQSQAELDGIARQLEAGYPENATWKLRLVPLREQVVGDVKRPLLMLSCAVALVLLVTCANAAGLLLTRGIERSGETALRGALGASPLAVARLHFTEMAVLACAAGGLGLPLARVVLQLVRSYGPASLPRLADSRPDARVVLFTFGLAALTTVLAGLAPVFHAGREQPASVLHDCGRGQAGRGGRTRRALVVAQIALSVALLASAGLMLRSLARLQSTDPGFEPKGVLTARSSSSEGGTRSGGGS